MKQEKVKLKVNGKEITLKPFIEDFIAGSIEGMVKSLRGCEAPEKIEITVTVKKD